MPVDKKILGNCGCGKDNLIHQNQVGKRHVGTLRYPLLVVLYSPTGRGYSVLITTDKTNFARANQTKKEMASTSAVLVAMPLTRATQKRQPPSADGFFKPLPLTLSSNGVTVSKRVGKFEVNASWKEKVAAGITAGALTTSIVVPDVAEAASGFSPSLKNFLLSIVAGGVVLFAIVGAVVGVANFDPVKRS